MKIFIRRIRLFLLMTSVFISVSAKEVINGIAYNFNSESRECSVTSLPNSEYSGDVVIPETVVYDGTKYSVTSIGESAFEGCTGLISVTIPNLVTSMDRYVFRNCSNLETIYYNAENCSGIGFYIAGGAGNWLNGCTKLKKVVIGEKVKSIPECFCLGCESLISMNIPNSVTSIGESAFEGCIGLISVTIPNSVTSMGGSVFDGCSGLTSVTISNKVTSIGDFTFNQCRGLTSVIIPNSVTSIGVCAFECCTSLTSVTIPNSVTSIGDAAFGACSGLTSVTIPKSVSSIGRLAFRYCTGLETIYFNAERCSGSGFTNYEDDNWLYNWLCNTPNLKQILIGENVKSIPANFCYKCTSLTSVEMPNSVISIGDNAFYKCTSLTSVTIPNSVTSIGNNAFYGCSGLTSVTMPNSLTSIGDCAFYGCTDLTSVTIPNLVTSIGLRAFNWCFDLNTIYFNAERCSGPGFTNSDDNWLALACLNMMQILIGENVKLIPAGFCYGHKYLTSVIIPNSVTLIGNSAFYSCEGLTSVTIGSSVNIIQDDAFKGCSALKQIRCDAITPPECFATTFDRVPKDKCVLIVPDESVEAYKAADYWNEFYVQSGAEQINVDDNAILCDIYNLSGIKVYENILKSEAEKTLKNGVYILKYENGSVEKIYVK